PVWADSGESSLRQADTEDLYQSECVLRIEATIHNTKEELPPVAGRMRGMVDGFLGRSMPSMLVSSPTILWSSYRRGWSGRRRWEASTVTSFASGQSAACRRSSIDCAARIHASDLAA